MEETEAQGADIRAHRPKAEYQSERGIKIDDLRKEKGEKKQRTNK